MERIVRVHAWVGGLVQGVYYRASTAREAAALGLSGWVRNLPDGRVEAVLEGPAAAVEQMLRWLHVGPPHARVTSVEVQHETPAGERGFRILT